MTDMMKKEIAEKMAKARWDSIAKPIDSLGKLEDMVVKMAGIRRTAEPRHLMLDKRALLVFCADHGVVESGVTQTGQDVTKAVADNFAAGRSTVNLLAERAACDVFPVDIGMNCPSYPSSRLQTGQVTDRKIMRGTNNLAKTSAMTKEECVQAIDAGKALVWELVSRGYKIIATGEMGIGNTTPTAALLAAYLNLSAEEAVGRGAGLSDEGLVRKRQAVDKALSRIREKELTDPVDILTEAGGFEIAAMAGVFIGGYLCHVPTIIDGAISSTAALAAYKICPEIIETTFASHISGERAGRPALSAMGLDAVLDGRLSLGEGTGCMLLLPLLDAAIEVYSRMGSFGEYDIKAYHRFGNEDQS